MTHGLVARINRLPWVPIITAVIVLAVLAYWLNDTSQNRDEQTARSRIEGCERAKLKDVANARGATAQAAYMRKVLVAASVQADVKRAATTAEQAWSTSAERLRSQLFLCEPLIRGGRKVIDEVALQEAKGEL